MADSASRAQRAAALEEKRRKLEELKKKRDLRKEDTAKVKDRAESTTKASLDDYIDGLLSQPSVPATTAEESRNNAQTMESSSRTAVAAGDGKRGEDSDNNQSKDTPSESSSAEINQSQTVMTKKMVETFVVGTQTEEDDFPEQKMDEDEGTALEEEIKSTDDKSNGAQKSLEEKLPKLLTLEEVEKEVAEPPFASFISTASKKVERIMGTPILHDLLADYIGEADGELQRTLDAKYSDASRFLSSRQLYDCNKWTFSRDITDIDWSPLHRELFLSTYHMPNSHGTTIALSKGSAAVSAIAPNDTPSASLTPRSGEVQSDGLLLVWSLSMPKRPEHVFTCGSPVMTGRFHPSEPTLILGGCESGQLVVWDVRGGRLPVQKSAIVAGSGSSVKSHTQPLCSMEIIEGGLGLVTASADGRVNFWSLENLREPVESIQVGESVSCFAVAPESDSLILGDDHGQMFSISASGGQRSSRKQLRKLDSMDKGGGPLGHYGMITSISTKILKSGSSLRTAGLSKGFLRGSGGLVLSSGVDWTVKLWSPAYSDAPLASFVSHSYDYMCDAKWSPVHPSLFATASSNGTLGLWNIASSLEDPLTGKDGIIVDSEAGQRGLNKISWSLDGRRIAVASGDLLHVLTLTEDVARPKGDEDLKTMNNLMARGLVTRQ